MKNLIPYLLVVITTMAHAESSAPAKKSMGNDEYLSGIVVSQGKPIFATNLAAAEEVCAKGNGRVPSVIDIMIDSYRRKTGVRFEGIPSIWMDHPGWSPSGGRESIAKYERDGDLRRFFVLSKEAGWKQYYIGFNHYIDGADPYFSSVVWTTDYGQRIRYSITGAEKKSIEPFVATRGGFDFYEPTTETSVRCVIPKIRAGGTSDLPCREVSPFADVGTRCVTSQKVSAVRIKDAHTGKLGWQDETDGTIYLDAKYPPIENRNYYTFREWDRSCRAQSKGGVKVELPNIDELKKLEVRGLREILNEERTLWSSTPSQSSKDQKESLHQGWKYGSKWADAYFDEGREYIVGRCIIRSLSAK